MSGPRVLVLAGHDPTGGAGVDADRRSLERLGVDADAIVTAWTDQDGARVRAVRPRGVGEVEQDLSAALGRRPVGFKTGLLPSAEFVRLAGRVATRMREAMPLAPIVVDPVLSASGGEEFLDAGGVEALRTALVPAGVVLTPNLPEAARLTCVPTDSPNAAVRAARLLLAWGAHAVIVKGGHAGGPRSSDLVLAAGDEPVWIDQERVEGPGIHGSGCRHAATLLGSLVLGASLVEAAQTASAFVADEIRAASGVRPAAPGEPTP